MVQTLASWITFLQPFAALRNSRKKGLAVLHLLPAHRAAVKVFLIKPISHAASLSGALPSMSLRETETVLLTPSKASNIEFAKYRHQSAPARPLRHDPAIMPSPHEKVSSNTQRKAMNSNLGGINYLTALSNSLRFVVVALLKKHAN